MLKYTNDDTVLNIKKQKLVKKLTYTVLSLCSGEETQQRKTSVIM